MLGASAVGKTSLVRRFVDGIFREDYVTTIGVKIDRKSVALGDGTVDLLLWDVNGEDRFQRVSSSYIRGSAGYLLVADGTRPQTLETARDLHKRARDTVGKVPYFLLINKVDLRDAASPGSSPWQVTPDLLQDLGIQDGPILYTSAKEDTRVEHAFASLARAFVAS